MKKWSVEIGFTGCENKDKIIYRKNYLIKAETDEIAGIIAYNGLSMSEFHNFKILKISEVEWGKNEH